MKLTSRLSLVRNTEIIKENWLLSCDTDNNNTMMLTWSNIDNIGQWSAKSGRRLLLFYCVHVSIVSKYVLNQTILIISESFETFINCQTLSGSSFSSVTICSFSLFYKCKLNNCVLDCWRQKKTFEDVSLGSWNLWFFIFWRFIDSTISQFNWRNNQVKGQTIM